MTQGGRRSPTSGTALVTGAAGFIGSGLVTRLLHDEWTVVGIDSFDEFYDPALKRGNLAPFEADPRFSLLELDIRETGELGRQLDRDLTRDIDVVVHAAALTGVRQSWSRPMDYYDVNVGGTAAVLELMRMRSIPHLVFVSSSSVYGTNPDVPWREDALPQPVSVYAHSKLAAERLVARAGVGTGFSVVATRLFTVYGPGQRPDLAIANFAARMIKRQPIPVFGDGSALRDFTYIDDIVDGLRAAIDYTGRPFEIFNLARSRPLELRHVITALEQLLDVEARVDYRDTSRGDVPRTWGSIEKSSRQLRYRPATDLEAGLEASLPWFHRLADLGICR